MNRCAPRQGYGCDGATEIDASFEQSEFPAEDPDDRLRELPDPIAPGTYTAKTAVDTLDWDFVSVIQGGASDLKERA